LNSKVLKFEKSSIVRFDIIGIILVLLGVLLQLRQFLIDRSFWLDEAYLANNITTHSVRFLMIHPLDSNQASPIGFLLGLKFLGKLFNYQDQYLRLVPLLFGISLLLIAYKIKDRFKHPIARYLFLGLLAFCPVLVYYSSELKSYILDTFACALMVWIGLNYRRWHHGYLIFLAGGILAILLSIPAVFFLAAAGISAMFYAFRRRDKPAMIRLAWIGFSWITIFGLYYYFSLRNFVNDSLLNILWANTFAPNPTSLENLKWYLDSLLGLAALGFSAPGPIPLVSYAAWYAPINWVMLAGLIAGA
jgi:predicted membrane-bound mannosyltransferase